uniref:Uncharacterized protein n=1 Tax=Branchiostoma floridae TaxID=7739 RepID=C3XUS5_BRAFL|eukprot:XP_002612141.1 hypothetical protein BRAFLDRAFT_88880 [Branchiostoma floridae]
MLSTLITLTTLLALSNAQSWVPSGDLPVDFTLTFSAPEMVYDVCNRNFTQSARTFTVATTGVAVTPGETANDPTAMTITGASSDPSTGAVIDPYRGPMPPPCSGDHTYHYLLLRQTAALSLTADDLPQYTPDCSLANLVGQCLFEVANFISSNQMTPVGYVTMVAATDGYVRYSYVNDRAQSWVPSGDLPVDFTVTFSAPEMVYDVCNRDFSQSARNITVATTGVPVTPGETAMNPTAMTITGASSGMSEADSCRGLDGYDPCPTAPPGSSSEKVMVSLSTVMASAWCLMFSFILN